jgi:hypothetical protein
MKRTNRGVKMDKWKTYNRIFTDSCYSFGSLKLYHGHILSLLRRSSSEFLEFGERLESELKQKQREFNKQGWLKQNKIYEEIYPGFFNNSFFISACALFEYQIKEICALVKEEHKVPLEWDDMVGSVPARAKRFLWFGGVMLKDDPPGSFQHWISTVMPSDKNMTIKELWQALENYYMVRNCLTHHNGVIQKLRNPDKVKKYAIEKGILVDKAGHLELLITNDFINEVCDTMGNFFQKLTGAYYSTPLP